jgi:hypothetical protein
MLARPFQRSDSEAIDALLVGTQHSIELNRDVVVVSGQPANSLLVWRPSAVVHELRVTGLHSANALVNYAVAQGRAHLTKIQDVIFLVDPRNEAMLRYAARIGAKETEGKVFTLALP